MARYPRWQRYAQQQADLRKVAELILEATRAELEPTPGSAGGDPQALRGIPAIGPNVTGAIPGTNPENGTLDRERTRSKRRR